MKTISFVSQKGGTGKTTLSVHMATIAHNRGYKVLLVDLDPQKSSFDWSRCRKIAGPVARSFKPGALFHAQIEARKLGFDVMIVDTPAATLDLSLDAARVSDLIVLVSRPTIIDFRALKELAGLVRALPIASALVLNQAPPQRLGREMGLVSENINLLFELGIHLAPVAIRARQVYQSSFANGLSAAEIQQTSPATDETNRLWSYLESRLQLKLRTESVTRQTERSIPALPKISAAQ
jgi:chromosome partitioning protein